MHTAMDWWTKIRLEVSREESSKREVLRREGIGWDTSYIPSVKRKAKISKNQGIEERAISR